MVEVEAWGSRLSSGRPLFVAKRVYHHMGGSKNRGPLICPQLLYSPYYRSPQIGTPNFWKPPYGPLEPRQSNKALLGAFGPS